MKWYKDELQKYGYNFDEIMASVKKKNKRRKYNGKRKKNNIQK